MPSLPLYDLNKKKVGNVDLSDVVFAGEVRPHLLNDAVRAQIAWRHEYRTANSRPERKFTERERKCTAKKVPVRPVTEIRKLLSLWGVVKPTARNLVALFIRSTRRR